MVKNQNKKTICITCFSFYGSRCWPWPLFPLPQHDPGQDESMGLRLPPAHFLSFFPVCLWYRSRLHETLEIQSFERVGQFVDIYPSNHERAFFHEQCFHEHQPDDHHIVLCTHVKIKHKKMQQDVERTYGIALVKSFLCLESATFFATVGDANIFIPYGHARHKFCILCIVAH